MTPVDEASWTTTSLMAGEEIPLTYRWPPYRWPRFKIGSAFLPSSFELAATLPGGWSTNVLEAPLFADEVFVLVQKQSLWDKLARLRSMIPAEERSRYPTDGARNLDKYLYRSIS